MRHDFLVFFANSSPKTQAKLASSCPMQIQSWIQYPAHARPASKISARTVKSMKCVCVCVFCVCVCVCDVSMTITIP